MRGKSPPAIRSLAFAIPLIASKSLTAARLTSVAVALLYLLRHAKSSWDDPALADHDRPLAPRGRRNGAALAEHVTREGIAPDLVLCSTALRARETLALLLPALGGEAEIQLEDELYGATADELLARL